MSIPLLFPIEKHSSLHLIWLCCNCLQHFTCYQIIFFLICGCFVYLRVFFVVGFVFIHVTVNKGSITLGTIVDLFSETGGP